MKELPLNVKMFPTHDCQEIIDEIEKEYPGGSVIGGGVRVWFAGQKEKFLKQVSNKLAEFDLISHALIIGERHTSYHLIQKGTRYGLYSGYRNGVIRPIEYLQIVPIGIGRRKENLFAAMDENYKWGITKERDFWDKDLFLVPFEFDDVRFSDNDYFPVKDNGKWGLYDSRKKELNLPVNYDEIKTPVIGFCPVKLEGKWGMYNIYDKDMLIEPMYDDANMVSEGLWAVKKDGKWGFVDLLNSIVVPFEYAWVSNFRLGYAHASKSEWMDYYDEALFDEEILLDHQGRRVYFVNPEYYDDNNREGLEIKKSYFEHVEYYYAVDNKGNEIIPKNKYRYLGRYSEGLFAASLDGEKLGYIDIEENIIIPFEYQADRWHGNWDDTDSFHWGIVSVGKHRYGRSRILINPKNEKVFPYTFRCDSLKYENGWFSSRWKLGEEFKRNSISIRDIINCAKGRDMAYLIRSEEEIDKERERERRMRDEEEPYQWTEEDAWDAMTDGMYGDYPGGDVDYEKIGF